MVHKVLLIVATANIKYNQMQLLRADRWPTILLCKVQVFQHFEKMTYTQLRRYRKKDNTHQSYSCVYDLRIQSYIVCTRHGRGFSWLYFVRISDFAMISLSNSHTAVPLKTVTKCTVYILCSTTDPPA